MTVCSEQYPIVARSPAIEFRPTLIGSVTDNIRDPAENMYYQIVRAGLYDDSRVYVDRIHEWNGIDASGIPEILRGADYVKVLQLRQVECAAGDYHRACRPRAIVCAVRRATSDPLVALRAIHQNGFVVGVDEGYSADHPAEQHNAYGAGESIDTTYDIWQADILEAGVVTLGALTKCTLEVSMYGIAAVPLDATEVTRRAAEVF